MDTYPALAYSVDPDLVELACSTTLPWLMLDYPRQTTVGKEEEEGKQMKWKHMKVKLNNRQKQARIEEEIEATEKR